MARTASRILIMIVIALVFSAAAGANSRRELPRKDDAGDRAGPSVFDRDEEVFGGKSFGMSETLKMSGRRLDSPSISVDEFMRGRSAAAGSVRSGGRKRVALAVLGSALLPGLGELYLYFETKSRNILWRAPVFLALEGYLWYGYSHNHDKGKNFKTQYEVYGDAHWSLDKFLTTHPCCASIGGCATWQDFNEDCRSEPNFFLYTSKEDDREEFYENIGKYDAFTYGWDDYETSMGEGFTSHRNYYWSLRDDSDRYLLRADQHLMGLVVARVVSMIDAGWLAYRINRGHYGADDWSIRLEKKFSTPMVTLRYRF